ncbi:hypothetical protein BSYN_20240 [Bacteroides sedimenti]|uniref:Uncharacterized protein n=1 Tax=Bacteroides sedimenti TaxID=2136147 RepID=A0ABN6ZCC5_9BACE
MAGFFRGVKAACCLKPFVEGGDKLFPYAYKESFSYEFVMLIGIYYTKRGIGTIMYYAWMCKSI